ncbi:hypothetical protein PSE_2199 [Pseudovibrio sp. FO-BEG1]|nr:hypothetical protein PSE_2199 [Pseudovibrio sp. FO-BEG1]
MLLVRVHYISWWVFDRAQEGKGLRLTHVAAPQVGQHLGACCGFALNLLRMEERWNLCFVSRLK